MENQELNLTEEREKLLAFLFRRRKLVIGFTLSVSIAVYGLSFLITPLFLSTAIVFPSKSSSVSFYESRNVKASSMDFGEEDQAAQLVQILQSSRIRDFVVSKYNLIDRYKIGSDDPNKMFKLNKAYEGHFSFERTRFGSIKIDVLDEDPKLASEMANAVVGLIDTVKNQMIQERALPAFEITKRKKDQLDTEIQALLDEMDRLAKLGVVSLDVRSRLFQALVDSKSSKEKEELRQKIDVNSNMFSKLCFLEMSSSENFVGKTGLFF